MRKMKRVTALMLILMMVFSSLSFATTSPSQDFPSVEETILQLLSQQEVQGEKLVGFDQVDLKSTKEVRIIVEFYGSPVIESATRSGLQVSEIDSSEVATMTRKINDEQLTIMNQIEREVEQLQVHQQFSNVFNGISLTVAAQDVKAISKLAGVKTVYIANEYARPEPLMVNSSLITQSNIVNEEYGYKGEGIVVAIIDTGLDANHQDFNIDPGTEVKFTQASVNAIKVANNLKGSYINEKVPYGWNYMDNGNIIQDIGEGASMHGMHVGGTVAANGIIKGVAPNAQLLALKVFGNDPDYPSTYADIIIAAIDDAITLGADVMNLSLGATAQNVDQNDPEQQAITRAVENGILMSISAGNSAHWGAGSTEKAGFPLASNPDFGVTGSPGLTHESTTVASVDNYTELNAYAVNHELLDTPFIGFASKSFIDGPYELAKIGGSKIGAAADFDGLDLTGKVALVSRGGAFVDTAINAKAAGAIGVVLYNAPGREIVTNLIETELPFMMIPAEGVIFETIIGNDESTTITINAESGVYSPTAGKLSSFSSWGTTPDMGFKPNVSAPGGQIYSTLENNEYGVMSGTSMAAPHVSGGAALVYQRLQETNDFNQLITKNQDLSKLVTAILMNTGRPVQDAFYGEFITDENAYDALITYTSPRKQGAGSMDLKSAVTTDVVIYNTASGSNYEAFYNAKEVTDGFEFNLTAFNQGDTDKYYNLEAVVQTNIEQQGLNVLESMILEGVSYTFTVGSQVVDKIVVPAGQSIDINVQVTLTNPTLAHNGMAFDQAFPNGNFIEGFVFFYELQSPESSEVLALKQVYVQANANIEAKEMLIEALEEQKNTIETEKLAPLTAATEAAQEAFDAVNEIKLAIEAMASAELAVRTAEEALVVYIGENGTLEENKADLLALQTQLAAETALAEAKEAHLLAQENVVTAQEALAKLTAKVEPLEEEIETKTLALEAFEEGSDSYKAILAEIKVLIKKLKRVNSNIEAKTNEITALEEIVVEAAAAELEAQEAFDAYVFIEDLAGEIAVVEGIITELKGLEKAVTDAQDALILVTVDYTEDQLASLETLESLEIALNDAKEAEALVLLEISTMDEMIQAEQLKLVDLITAFELARDAYVRASATERNTLPLSVPFMSFKGNWSQAPAFDGVRGTDEAYYRFTTLLYNNSPADQFYFMDLEHSAFSPNGDDKKEEVTIIYTVLRNLVDISYEIEDADNETVFEIKKSSSLRKDFYDGGAGGASKYKLEGDTAWNGLINYEVAPEGLYYYVIKGNLVDGTKKELRFPVQLDISEPEFVGYEWSETLKANFADNLSGISEYMLVTTGQDSNGALDILETGNTTGEFDLTQYNVKGGDYVFVAAFDYASNLSIGDMAEIENIRPEISIQTPGAYDALNTREVTIKGRVEDGSPVSVALVFDKGQATENEVIMDVEEDGSFEYDAVFTRDGKTGIYVKALDLYGNEFSYTRWFFIDSQAPTVEVIKVTADTEEGAELLITDGKVLAPAGTKNLYVKLRVTDNYPELTIKINGSVKEVIGQDVDWYSTEANIQPVDHVGTYKVVTLGKTNVPVIIEVTDALGNMTVKGFEGNVIAPVTPGNPFVPKKPDPTETLLPVPSVPVPSVPTPAKEDEFRILEDAKNPLGAVDFDKAYMDGYADGTFKPDAMITRAQLAKIYVNILGLEMAKDAEQSFDDVSKDHWAFAYVEALKVAGIFKGYDDGSFKPDQELKLSELAQTFTNYWAYLELEVSDKAVEGLNLSNHWSASSIYRLFNANVVKEGMIEIQPEAYVSRAKIVLMMNSLLGRSSVEVDSSKYGDVTDLELIGAIEAATTTVIKNEK